MNALALAVGDTLALYGRPAGRAYLDADALAAIVRIDPIAVTEGGTLYVVRALVDPAVER